MSVSDVFFSFLFLFTFFNRRRTHKGRAALVLLYVQSTEYGKYDVALPAENTSTSENKWVSSVHLSTSSLCYSALS